VNVRVSERGRECVCERKRERASVCEREGGGTKAERGGVESALTSPA